MMNLQECDYQILRLTDTFYEDYPNPPYREILKKKLRAYECLLIETHYDYFICIPFRSEITHTYAYHFQKSVRSRNHKSGLDYTKIVIVKKTQYIDDKNALVDKDEFNETMINLERIKREALSYVEEYIAHIKGEKVLHKAEFKRKYEFSTLRYFHREMGL